MCGIVGYAGDLRAASILLDGLARLEYRGYDSAGIAVADRAEDGTETLEVVKAKGRLKVLCEMEGQWPVPVVSAILDGPPMVNLRWPIHIHTALGIKELR